MNLLQLFGARPQKEPKFAPIFIDRAFTGLYTQRSPLHDPSDLVTARFYGGRPDALLGGSNVELTNRLTLQRRAGHTAFSAATYPDAPIRAFEFRLTSGAIQVLIDTPTHIYLDNQDGTKTTILTKSAGAGQGYFVSVGNVCYIGDGIDLIKYTPGNPNGIVWNWGGAAPTTPPSVKITQSALSAVAWQANTVFSTMGLIVDPNGNVQQLVSVNATGANATQFGTSGNGQPAWSNTPGVTTADGAGTLIWTNWGPVAAWAANKTYNNGSTGGTLVNPAIIYDPASNSCYITAQPGQGTTGNNRPPFSGGFGSIFHDGTVKWFCVGTPKNLSAWAPSHAYPLLGSVPNNDSASIIVEPLTLPAPAGQTVFAQAVTTAGTSGTGGTAPAFAKVAGNQTNPDGQLIWNCLGSSVWSAALGVTQWAANQPVFSVIKDTNGNLQVCVQSGATGGVQPTWETAYGSVTPDGTAKWVCVGASVAWTANTIWFLPASGFAAPSASQPYGGAEIKDQNGNTEFVIISGKSGAGPAPPAFATTAGTTTPGDGAITWINNGAATTNALVTTKSHNYGFSYKARRTDDFFVTNIPPGLSAPLGPPTGSATGLITTSSPAQVIGPNTGAVNTISGPQPTDPQFDTIVIWRDPDGGGPSNMDELTEIPATPGSNIPWSFTDFLPDVPTAQFPGLNNLIPAPINGTNNPPPAGFLPMQYHFAKIWGAVGPTVFISGGSDVLTGNPNEAFSKANNFPFLSGVTRLVATNAGMITHLTSDIEIIAGGPQTASFFPTKLVPGVGLTSYNALDIHGGEIYFFSADAQFLSLDPSLSLSRSGFAIGDQLASLNPANVYVTVHEAGTDNAVYVGDGSTGWFRLNPHQVPQGEAIWSPKANVVGGCQMVQSVEITKGVHKLLVGGTGANQNILQRNLSVFTDNGTQYDAFFIMGSIVLAHPGQQALLGFIEADFSGANYQPTVGFLLNEISGTFTNFTFSVADPPDIYGANGAPTSYSPNRYYFSQTRQPAKARHLQIKVDFGTTANGDEIFNMTIFGALYQEK